MMVTRGGGGGPRGSANSLAFLYLLRFIFAISIILWHYPYYFFTESISNYPVLEFCRNLTICAGNQAFLLISGMLFYLTYFQRIHQQTLSIKKFLWSRVKKFYPIASVATLMCFALCLVKGNTFNLQSLIIDLFFFGNTLLNGGYGNFNGPGYYLGLLLFCYLVSSLCLLLMRKKDTVLWFLIPLLTGFFIANKQFDIPFFLFNNWQIGFALYNFFLGFFFMLLLQKAENNLRHWVKIVGKILCFILGTAMLILLVVTGYNTNLFGPVSDTAFAIWIWIPIFTALYGTRINRLFDNRFFKFLNGWSIYLFLFHTFSYEVLNIIIKFFHIQGNPFVWLTIYIGTTFAISLLCKILLPKLIRGLGHFGKVLTKESSDTDNS